MFLQCGFALRYINIFFCPAFVTLPLSPSISGVEVAKIIAVFSECRFIFLLLSSDQLQSSDMLPFLLSQHTWSAVFSSYSGRPNVP